MTIPAFDVGLLWRCPRCMAARPQAGEAGSTICSLCSSSFGLVAGLNALLKSDRIGRTLEIDCIADRGLVTCPVISQTSGQGVIPGSYGIFAKE